MQLSRISIHITQVISFSALLSATSALFQNWKSLGKRKESNNSFIYSVSKISEVIEVSSFSKLLSAALDLFQKYTSLKKNEKSGNNFICCLSKLSEVSAPIKMDRHVDAPNVPRRSKRSTIEIRPQRHDNAKDQVDNHVSGPTSRDWSLGNETTTSRDRRPGNETTTSRDRRPGNQTTMRQFEQDVIVPIAIDMHQFEQDVSDPIAIDIVNMIENNPTFWPNCCIYGVSGRLRKGYEDFYTPRVVGIGPYHYRNGQGYKCIYLEAFFSRNILNLDQCLGVLRELEGKAKSYYVEPILLDSDEFTKMLLVDGTFLLELMLRHYFADLVDDCDRIYGTPRLIQDVYRDLMLIENQIPFFVLEALYIELHRKTWRDLPSLVTLTHEFFKYLVKVDKFPGPEKVEHFVDFIRCYYLPKCDSKNDNEIINDVPSITAMDEAGVRFEGRKELITLLDIEFTNGSLRIPQFIVDDWTETLFRNLIAFEQCHDHKVKYITQFMFLMGSMIRTPKDADLLINREIVSCRLGNSEDISTIFNNICKGVSLGGPFYYFTLCKDLNAYCKSPCNSWKATLKRDYFNTPWKLVSTIAAFVLLVLTVIQAVCSILSVS